MVRDQRAPIETLAREFADDANAQVICASPRSSTIGARISSTSSPMGMGIEPILTPRPLRETGRRSLPLAS